MIRLLSDIGETAHLVIISVERLGFGKGLDRHRVNGRRNRIESDAVTNETASV